MGSSSPKVRGERKKSLKEKTTKPADLSDLRAFMVPESGQIVRHIQAAGIHLTRVEKGLGVPMCFFFSRSIQRIR